MPQAFSMFPTNASLAPAPRSPIAPSNTSSDGGSSRFDDVLQGAKQDARQAEKPADVPSSDASAKSADKTSKPAKAKGGKTGLGKPTGKSRNADDATDAEQENADGADPALHTAGATVAGHVALPEPADVPATPKGKAASKATKANAAATTPAPMVPQAPNAVPQPVGVQRSEPKPASDPVTPAIDPATVVKAKPPTAGADETIDLPKDAAPATTGKNAADAAERSADATDDSATQPNGVMPDQPPAGPGIKPESNAANASPAIANAAVSMSDDDGDDDTATAAPSAAATSNIHDAASVAHAAQPALHGFAAALAAAQPSQTPATNSAKPTHAVAAPPPPLPPAQQFVESNHSQIVGSIHAQLLPNGGSMQIRLDPPDLGTMNVSVHMRDGVLTASFQTSTDQASRLLSHSLGQLKTALESQGVSVGSLHVQQTPKDPQPQSQEDQNSNNNPKDNPAQQEQQRREMLRKMWARLNGGKDPLDMVA